MDVVHPSKANPLGHCRNGHCQYNRVDGTFLSILDKSTQDKEVELIDSPGTKRVFFSVAALFIEIDGQLITTLFSAGGVSGRGCHITGKACSALVNLLLM